jgi:hypothetical protein
MMTVVFVGPTLRADEVRALLPRAVLAPPVACGDLLGMLRARRHVDRIAIIDGYFEGRAAVWHKEILLALERGIAVYGAASMGALRAAELAAFGMVGVGVIYRAYRRGELVADDEVAVGHAPAELGYTAFCDPLVNIRFGLARAVRARIVRARIADQLLELARARHYRERTWRLLLDDAVGAGVPATQLAALARWPKPDQKAADARALLRRVGRDASGAQRRQRFIVPRTWALRALERVISSKQP